MTKLFLSKQNLNGLTPAEQGENAARKEVFIRKLCERFTDFAVESLCEHGDNFDDHLEYLEACFEIWIEVEKDHD